MVVEVRRDTGESGSNNQRLVLTKINFGAQPSLNAILVNILQTASAAAGLNQGVG